MWIGTGLRPELEAFLHARPALVDCVEVTAEHFFRGGEQRLRSLRERYPLLVHSHSLSLGTPGPLDPDRMRRLARVVEWADPRWVSEHVAFTRTSTIDLGHLNPVPATRYEVEVVAAHAAELADECGRPVLLENITTHVLVSGELSEPEFLNRICDRAGCGLLLDITNLYVNSRNHGFDPLVWLRDLDAKYVRQMHIVGYSRAGARLTDEHAEDVQDEVLELAVAALDQCAPEVVILERDTRISSTTVIHDELGKLHAWLSRPCVPAGARSPAY